MQRIGALAVFENGVLPKKLPQFNVDELRNAALRGDKLSNLNDFLSYVKLPADRKYTNNKFVADACSRILELAAPMLAKMAHHVGKTINESFYSGDRAVGHLIWSIYIFINEDVANDNYRQRALNDLDFSHVKHPDAQTLYRYMRVMHTSNILLSLVCEVTESLGHMVDVFKMRYKEELEVAGETVRPDLLRQLAKDTGANADSIRNFDSNVAKTTLCFSHLYPYQAADALCDVYYNQHIEPSKISMLATSRYGYNVEELAKSFQWLRSETLEAILDTEPQRIEGFTDWLFGRKKQQVNPEDDPEYRDEPGDSAEVNVLKRKLRKRLKLQREDTERYEKLRGDRTAKGKEDETPEMEDLRLAIKERGDEISQLNDELIEVQAKIRGADEVVEQRRKEAQRNPDNIYKYRNSPSIMEEQKERREKELREVEATITMLDMRDAQFRESVRVGVQETMQQINNALLTEIADSDTTEAEKLLSGRDKINHKAKLALISESGAAMIGASDMTNMRKALEERKSQLRFEIAELTSQQKDQEVMINKASRKYCSSTIVLTAVSSAVWGLWSYSRSLGTLLIQSRNNFLADGAKTGVASFCRYILKRYDQMMPQNPGYLASLFPPSSVDRIVLSDISNSIISEVINTPQNTEQFTTLMKDLMSMTNALEAENFGNGAFYKTIVTARVALEKFGIDPNVKIEDLRTVVNAMLRICLSVGNKLEQSVFDGMFDAFTKISQTIQQGANTTAAAAFSIYSYAKSVNAPSLQNLTPNGLFTMAASAKGEEYVTAAHNLIKSIITTGLGYTSLVLLLYSQVSWSLARYNNLDTNLSAEVTLWMFGTRTVMIGVIDVMMQDIMTSTQSMSVLQYSFLAGIATVASLMMPGYGWIGAIGRFLSNKVEKLRAPRTAALPAPTPTVAQLPPPAPAADMTAPVVRNLIRNTVRAANVVQRSEAKVKSRSPFDVKEFKEDDDDNESE